MEQFQYMEKKRSKKVGFAIFIWIIIILFIFLAWFQDSFTKVVYDVLETILEFPLGFLLLFLLVIAGFVGSWSLLMSVLLLFIIGLRHLNSGWTAIIPLPYFSEISPLVWFIALIGTLIIKSPFARGIFFMLFGQAYSRIMGQAAPLERSYQRSQTSKKQPRIRTRSSRGEAMGYQMDQTSGKQEKIETPRTREEVMDNISEYMPEQTRMMIENAIPEEIMEADDPDLKKLSKKMRIPKDVLRAVIEGKKKRDLEESEV